MPAKSLDRLRDRSGGFLAEEEKEGYLDMDAFKGLGQPLDAYLPKNAPYYVKFVVCLTPSNAPVTAVAEFDGKMRLVKAKAKGKGETGRRGPSGWSTPSKSSRNSLIPASGVMPLEERDPERTSPLWRSPTTDAGGHLEP